MLQVPSPKQNLQLQGIFHALQLTLLIMYAALHYRE